MSVATTAVVRRLRELLQMIPPGDLRKCLVALAEPGSPLATAFEYRFAEEDRRPLLGNLILVGLIAAPDPVAASTRPVLLGVQGRVLPATTEPVVLKARSAGGQVDGQVAVMGTDHIRTVSLVPADPKAPGEALAALEEADQVILGPGSLFTSVLAPIAVPDIREGIRGPGPANLHLLPPSPGPRNRGIRRGMHIEALAVHGIAVDIAVCDTSGLPPGNPRVELVDTPLARPSGLAHDPATGMVSGLLG